MALLGPRRLAEYATRRPRRVLAAWGALVLVSMGLVGTLLAGELTADQKLTNHPESYAARDLIDARLPDQKAVDEVVVVRSKDAVVSDPAFAARVRTLADEARRSGSVRQIRSYLDPGGGSLVSADRQATLLPVVLAEEKVDRIEDLVPIVERAGGAGDFDVQISGNYTLGRDFGIVSEQDLKTGELQFGLPAALVVLLLVFGSLVGAAIPMVMAITSILVGLGLGLVALVGQVVQLNLFITNMVVAMGLALGIDYSLFIVSRLREERHRGATTHEAILTVATTATRAVVFSGTAFTLAMIGMLIVPDTTLRSLGFGAVVVGVVSVAAALTFHPAILMVLGDRVDRARVPWLGRRVAASAGEEGRLWRLDRAADHGRGRDHHRRLRRLRHRPARGLPGDGLRHRRRVGARRDARAPRPHPGRHAAARRAQLVPPPPARVAPRPAGRGRRAGRRHEVGARGGGPAGGRRGRRGSGDAGAVTALAA